MATLEELAAPATASSQANPTEPLMQTRFVVNVLSPEQATTAVLDRYAEFAESHGACRSP